MYRSRPIRNADVGLALRTPPELGYHHRAASDYS